MVYIGNDIVRLDHPANRSVSLTTRYLNKLYLQVEQHVILHHENSIDQLWLLWSCKEVAFKIFKKIGVMDLFEPKKLHVSTLAKKQGSNLTFSVVHYEEHQIFIKSIIQENYILSVGCNEENQLESIQFSVAAGTDENESMKVRELLLELYSNFYPNASDLEVKKDVNSIPFLTSNEKVCPVDISLTHDYGLVSASFLNKTHEDG